MFDWVDHGGPDVFEATFTNPRFEIPINAINDNPVLIVDIATDDPDYPLLAEQRFGIGKGWVVVSDGAEVRRADGRKPKFHAQSKLGKLVDSIIKQPNFAGLYGAHGEQAAPTQVAFWNGLRARLERVTETFTDDQGNTREYTVFVATEFLGWANSGGGDPDLQALASEVKNRGGSNEEFVTAAYSRYGDWLVKHPEIMSKIDSGELFAKA